MSQTSKAVAESHDWLVCPGCQTILYRKRWIRALKVCPECGAHSPLDARVRLE